MLSTIIITFATLLIHKTSSCASILVNGVPSQPLHVCAGYKSSSMTFYYQLVCDMSGNAVYMSAHYSPTCSDDEFMEIPYPLDDGMTVNCEQVYDCSYAKYRLYDDSKNNCTHNTSTPYFELPMVIDECAYDTSVGGSKFYSCDDSGIYSNVQIGDTDAVCEDTQETPFIEEGCTDSTGQYVEVSECVYNEKEVLSTTAVPTSDDKISCQQLMDCDVYNGYYCGIDPECLWTNRIVSCLYNRTCLRKYGICISGNDGCEPEQECVVFDGGIFGYGLCIEYQ